MERATRIELAFSAWEVPGRGVGSGGHEVVTENPEVVGDDEAPAVSPAADKVPMARENADLWVTAGLAQTP